MAILAAAGVLAAFTAGMGFLILAATLAAAAPFRRNRPVYWAIVDGTLAFLITVIVLAPGSCTTAPGLATPSGPATQAGPTVCRDLVGMTYATPGNGSPPWAPFLLLGLGAALAVAAASGLLLRRRTSAASRWDPSTPAP